MTQDSNNMVMMRVEKKKEKETKTLNLKIEVLIIWEWFFFNLEWSDVMVSSGVKEKKKVYTDIQ